MASEYIFVVQKCLFSISNLLQLILSPSSIRHNWRLKLFKFFVVVVIAYSVFTVFKYLTTNHSTRYDILEIDSCPACYGRKACPYFFRGDIKISSYLERYPMLHEMHSKKVYRATMIPNQHVILKRLAPHNERTQIDGRICAYQKSVDLAIAGVDNSDEDDSPSRSLSYYQRAIRDRPTCSGSEARTAMIKRMGNDGAERLQVYHLSGLSDMTRCPSRRLLERILSRYEEKAAGLGSKYTLRSDELMIISTLLFNQEPIFLQTFPWSEGYPFTRYLGSCGRWVVEEDVGEPLYVFKDAPWKTRVALAHQVLQIADKLTLSAGEWALYMLDADWENFAVERLSANSYRVRYVDLENVVVVDLAEVRRVRPLGYNEFYAVEHRARQSGLPEPGPECPSSATAVNDPHDPRCLPSASTRFPGSRYDALCSRVHSDHNYYAVCRDVLASYTEHVEDGDGAPDAHEDSRRGLLHSLPPEIEREFGFQQLLAACIDPSQKEDGARLAVKQKLLDALDTLRKRFLP